MEINAVRERQIGSEKTVQMNTSYYLGVYEILYSQFYARRFFLLLVKMPPDSCSPTAC